MANVSSFYGDLYFLDGAEPWTPAGFLLAYEVFMSIDASGGGYGVALAENVTENSADFLAFMLDQAAEGMTASIGFWGNGKWSAGNTIECFPVWTMTPGRDDIDRTIYQQQRQKLLELMHENDWHFQFDYTDEESGIGFIVSEATMVMHAVINPTPTIVEGVYQKYTFEVYIEDDGEEYDHNLKNYSKIIEGTRRGDNFWETIGSLKEILQVPDEHTDDLAAFIIENDWDEHLPACPYYNTIDELPEGFVEAWRKYLND